MLPTCCHAIASLCDYAKTKIVWIGLSSSITDLQRLAEKGISVEGNFLALQLFKTNIKMINLLASPPPLFLSPFIYMHNFSCLFTAKACAVERDILLNMGHMDCKSLRKSPLIKVISKGFHVLELT